jgi:hypothetical protein
MTGGRDNGDMPDVEGPRPVGAAREDGPFLPMFQVFRDELNDHYDRRERVYKTSRDITALSKKMYRHPITSYLPPCLLTHFTAYSPCRGELPSIDSQRNSPYLP